MSKIRQGEDVSERPLASEQRTGPAVGVVATETNGDEIARIVSRANQAGYPVLVTYPGDGTLESVRLARRLYARVIDPDPTRLDEASLRRTLATAAREQGFPGLLLHRHTSEYIDYETSTTELRSDNDYAVETVTKSPAASTETVDVLVAIPAYNEAETIADVVTNARDDADDVLVVDDGSTDDTAARAKEAGAVVVEHERNRGYGGAIRTAFTQAKRRNVERLVVLDGDGQHDPADIRNLLATQRTENADIVIGSRFSRGATTELPRYRWVGLTVINLLTNLSQGVVSSEARVKDTQSGFRVYNRRAIESLAADDSIGDGMGASTDILHHARRRDYRIEEVGTQVDYDVENANNHNPVIHGLHLVRNILRTVERDRPITVLGLPGFAVSFVGLFFGYWAVSNYLRTQTLPTGVALTSTFLLLVGILACFTAIILHAIQSHID
jgi:glycosyltransferase involved in cell wall biosynthesis